jgi:hypothetical protein
VELANQFSPQSASGKETHEDVARVRRARETRRRRRDSFVLLVRDFAPELGPETLDVLTETLERREVRSLRRKGVNGELAEERGR